MVVDGGGVIHEVRYHSGELGSRDMGVALRAREVVSLCRGGEIRMYGRVKVRFCVGSVFWMGEIGVGIIQVSYSVKWLWYVVVVQL